MKYIKAYKLFEFENSDGILDCSYRDLKNPPVLPKNLERLFCQNNKLTHLPYLPKNLEVLYCSYNELTYLPVLPKTLNALYCDNNKLSSLPELPENLVDLYCRNNLWEEPIRKEYVEKFEFDETSEIYTKKQIKMFSSEDFQRKFLTEKPERYGDLSCLGITVHPKIRKEFSWIFEGEGMGFFNLKTKE